MTTAKATILSISADPCAPAVAQPPCVRLHRRRSVTLSLAEYNRLPDSRAGARGAAAPVAAVVSSADLRLRVDCDSVRGAFTLRATCCTRLSRVNAAVGRHAHRRRGGGEAAGAHRRWQRARGVIPGPGQFSLALEWVRRRPSGRAGRRSCCRCLRQARYAPRSMCRATRPTPPVAGPITRRTV